MKFAIRLFILILLLELSGHKAVTQAAAGMQQELISSQEARTAQLCTEGLGTLLLEYGMENSDKLLPQLLDTSSSLISFTTPFPYFGKNETTLYVNTHGILSFEGSFVDYTPEPFTQVNNAVVAIYWADGDIRLSGTISYRMVEATQDLEYIQGLLSSAFDLRDFEPELVFVATYADIPQTYQSNSLRNTFQAVLVTNGVLSFIIMSYQLIEWGECCGNVHPNVGFNSDKESFTLPLAMTSEIASIQNGSNVGIKGLYMYRVDQETVMEPRNNTVCCYWSDTNSDLCDSKTEASSGTSGSGANYITSGSRMEDEQVHSSGSGMDNQTVHVNDSTLEGTEVALISSKPVPVLLGDYIILTCSVKDNQTTEYSYSWSHNGTDLPDETTPTLVLAGVRTSDVGLYQCTITDGYDAVSATLVLHSQAIIQRGTYSAKLSSYCNSQGTRDDTTRDVVQLMSSEFGFQPLGKVKVFPAASCEEISHTHSQLEPGLYWIAEDGMEPMQIFCIF